MKPGGYLRRRARPKTDTDAAGTFHAVVCSQPCIGAGIPGHVCEGPLQAMHVVPKQTLKRRNRRDLLWDPENGVAGCYRIHRRHDLAVEKIPGDLLPARCVRWAAKHGLLDSLERHWPSEDSSLGDAA